MHDFQRDSHEAKIIAVKAKIKKAGGLHKKDLVRQLHRLKKELIIYDKYHKQAVMNSG